MARRDLCGLALMVLALGGCATVGGVGTEMVAVSVPVAVHRTPPPELLAPPDAGELPEFVAPTDPAATSALTPEGERRLKSWLLELKRRDEMWRAWGASTSHERQGVPQ